MHFREIERLEAGKYAGFNKPSEVEKAITELKRIYGFLQTLDPIFAKWRQAARRSLAEGPPDDRLIPGTDLTFAEGRKRTLRAKVKEACARLYGVR